MDVKCKDCVYARDILVKKGQMGKEHTEYVEGVECKLGYQIKLGYEPGCGGKEFELRR
jgi:hypothetical protein